MTPAPQPSREELIEKAAEFLFGEHYKREFGWMLKAPDVLRIADFAISQLTAQAARVAELEAEVERLKESDKLSTDAVFYHAMAHKAVLHDAARAWDAGRDAAAEVAQSWCDYYLGFTPKMPREASGAMQVRDEIRALRRHEEEQGRPIATAGVTPPQTREQPAPVEVAMRAEGGARQSTPPPAAGDVFERVAREHHYSEEFISQLTELLTARFGGCVAALETADRALHYCEEPPRLVAAARAQVRTALSELRAAGAEKGASSNG